MGNQAKITISTGVKDINCDMLLAAFIKEGGANDGPVSDLTLVEGSGGGEYYSVELRVAEVVHLQAGLQPSYAKINIPMANFGPAKWEESAYAVAFKKAGAGRILLKSRCCVYMYTSDKQRVPLLNGTVVSVGHDVKLDSAVVTVWDDKFLLSKVTCFGQAQYDPAAVGSTAAYGFVSNAKLIFNEFGWPNCMDKKIAGGSGTVPVFAKTIRYGWQINPQNNSTENSGAENSTDNSEGEPAPGKAFTRARSWRVSDAVAYLKMMHYGQTNSARPQSAMVYPGQRIAEALIWPDGIEQLFNNGKLLDRALKHCVCEGLTLDAALTKIAHRAGPFELFMAPSAGNGGNNGNDVQAGMLANGLAAFNTLQGAFDGQIASLNTAFTTGYSAFNTALNTATTAFGSAITSFQSQLGGPYDNAAVNSLNELSTLIRNKLSGLGSNALANPADFMAQFQADWKNALAYYGAMLDGNTGRYTLPNGAITGGGAGDNAGAGTGVGAGPAGLVGLGNVAAPGLTMKQLAGTTPSGNKSQMTFVDMRGVLGKSAPIIPALYGYDLPTALGDGNSVSGGYIEESVINSFDGVVIVGDAPVYEVTASTFAGDSADPLGAGYLEAAWDRGPLNDGNGGDEKAFKQYIGANGNNKKAFDEACQLYPLVYCAYRLSYQYMQLIAGTKWKGQFQARAHPRLRPTLLTGYQQNVSTPRNWLPRPIVIEYRTKQSSPSTWNAGGLYDNLQLSQDGEYFTITSQRDNGSGVTWFNTASSGNDYDCSDSTTMVMNDIRATLALELDFRLMTSCNVNPDKDMENAYKARVLSKDKSQFYYTALASDGDYVDWNRFNAAPVGQLLPSKYRQYPNKAAAGAGGNLFTDYPTATTGRAYNHTQIRTGDVRRIEGGAQFILPRFSPTYCPGAGIHYVASSEIPFRGVVSSATFYQNRQEMVIEVGVGSPSDITRGPSV